MRFVLVFPRIPYFESEIPPAGLAYIAAVLKNRDVDVKVYDMNVMKMSEDELVDKILKDDPACLGFSCSTPTISKAIKISDKVKKNNKKILTVFGGPHPTIMYSEILKNPSIDICVLGEGEETISEIVDFLDGKRKLDSIDGVAYKENDSIKKTKPRTFTDNLDSLPFPAWEFFPVKEYESIVTKGKISLPIVTSRGCPYQCLFCYKGTFGVKYRFRSPENVVNEIEYLKKEFKIDEFSINDDNFTLIPKRAIDICKLVIERNINLTWRCTNGIRADTVSDELIRMMKEAGCKLIAYGVESGDEDVLVKIRKQEKLDDFRRAFSITKKHGIKTIGFFMIGNIGENEKTMEKTINFAKELDPDYAQFSIATPFPGTEMYNTLKLSGEVLIDSWDDYALYAGKAVFKSGELTPELMEKMFRKANRDFYLRSGFIIKKLLSIRNINDVRELFHGFLHLIRR